MEKSEKLKEQQAALKQEETRLLRQLNKAENRKGYIDASARKQRTHRLITRGAAMESLIPEIMDLTETQFFLAAESFFADETIRKGFLEKVRAQAAQDTGGKS